MESPLEDQHCFKSDHYEIFYIRVKTKSHSQRKPTANHYMLHVTPYLEDGGLVNEFHQLVAVEEFGAATAADAVCGGGT